MSRSGDLVIRRSGDVKSLEATFIAPLFGQRTGEFQPLAPDEDWLSDHQITGSPDLTGGFDLV